MGGVSATYLGQCGFLLEMGGVRIVTDPYLSDYVDKSFFSSETPWRRLYPPPVTLGGLSPDVLLISHSHGDHMDPWTLKAYYGAGGSGPVAAPAPECGLLYDLGASVICARAESSFSIGEVEITPIPCAHTQLHLDELGRFHELSYLISCKGVTVFFAGDMSLYDGLEKRLRAAQCSLLLLPVNGGDRERTEKGIIGNIDHRQAAALAATLNVPYIPMHHDLYGINGCGETDILSAAREAGAEARLLKPMETWTL